MQRKSFNQSWFLSVFARVAVVTLVAIVPLCLGCEAQTPPQVNRANISNRSSPSGG